MSLCNTVPPAMRRESKTTTKMVQYIHNPALPLSPHHMIGTPFCARCIIILPHLPVPFPPFSTHTDTHTHNLAIAFPLRDRTFPFVHVCCCPLVVSALLLQTGARERAHTHICFVMLIRPTWEGRGRGVPLCCFIYHRIYRCKSVPSVPQPTSHTLSSS